jgi:formamidopyrimidine-DNA glycosylase
MTEAGSKRRAAIHLVHGEAALREHDPGGLDVFASDLDRFSAALTRENHTLKRALTDPALISGIGNAYSDEILHRAQLSPVKLSRQLSEQELARLFDATRAVLREWIDRLRREAGGEFPEGVTAFRPDMAVHGRYGKPCPSCGAPVQRIVYAENETNYCARCQTGGKLLADRALSRLLRADWPRSVDALEQRRQRGGIDSAAPG